MRHFIVPLISVLLLCVSSHAVPSTGGDTLFRTNFDDALAVAKKSKKPLIIDFFGIWCPPCNDLDELVFSHPDFRRKAAKFVAVKLDADAETSWKAKDRYKIGGYPTVLFLKPDGEEIERIVGFRALRDFLKVMDRAAKPGALTLEKACKRKEPEQLLRCVKGRAERKESKEAMAAFAALEKKLKPGSFEFIEAASAAADFEANRDLKRQRLLTLMNAHPEFPSALLWASHYLDTFEEGGTEKPDPVILRAVGDKFAAQLAHPRRGEVGLSESDLYQMRAVVVSSAQPELSKQLWADAATAMQKLAVENGREPGRGFVLEQIGCVERAGRMDEALELAETFRTKYPNEFTFHLKVANLHWRRKNAPFALEAAESAYAKSYGDNRLRVAMLLMELYPANSRPGDASRVYEEVTKEIQPSSTLDVRTHRYLKQLREARDRHVPATSGKKS